MNGSITVEELEAIIEERENKLFFLEAAHTLHALLEARRLFADIELKMNGLDINSPEEGFMAYVKNLYTFDLHYRHFIHEANQAESQHKHRQSKSYQVVFLHLSLHIPGSLILPAKTAQFHRVGDDVDTVEAR